MRYFYYEKVAREANIPSDKLDELSKIIRKEFPHSDMMYELHLLRACRAIQEGYVTIDDAIRPKPRKKH